ncbi:MAG: hypothetical protein C0600_13000 [Ignavibacteria bacterium]|nr:MAG: hypothetical protein C0600_13000 [Ignavibacteria bacterium]
MLQRLVLTLFPLLVTLLFTGSLISMTSCTADTPSAPDTDPQDSTRTEDSLAYAAADTLCLLQDDEITELSGIAASRRQSPLLWMHNDSGDEPRLFAVDSTGRTLAICRLSDATHIDWEDMASATLDGIPWLYIGDIGDNDAKRDSIIIYRVPEPLLSTDWDRHPLSVEAERASFVFEDGPRDSEALAVDARDGTLILIEKTGDALAGVYGAAWPGDGGSGMLTRMGSIDIPFSFSILRYVTGADLSVEGDRMVVRCYGGIIESNVMETHPLSAHFTNPDWKLLPAAALFQPEAVCYSRDGRQILTGSEGNNTPILRFRVLQP